MHWFRNWLWSLPTPWRCAELTAWIDVYKRQQVVSPGVYELPAGSRVYQAVEAAGGMTDGAAWQINQAQELTDGKQVYVTSKEEASDAGIDVYKRQGSIR